MEIIDKSSLTLLVFLLILGLSGGCSSQTESSTYTEPVIPSPTIKDLHNVNFHLIDRNDTPISNTYITANFNSTEYPGLLNTPNNNRGYTDDSGNFSFVMRGSVKYNITVSNLKNKQILQIELNPINSDYILKITPKPTPSPEPTRTNEWDHINDNNWILKIAKGVCSVIPTINDALNC